MNILVDYDNVERALREKGLIALADRIINLLGVAFFRLDPRARIRLYAGWYVNSTPTRLAQDLTAQISRDFARLMHVTPPNQSPMQIKVSVELATSLEAEPAVHLPNTFRDRVANRVSCKEPASICKEDDCRLLPVHHFFSKGRCPREHCLVMPPDLVQKNEQKLVDSMLITDLFFLSLQLRRSVNEQRKASSESSPSGPSSGRKQQSSSIPSICIVSSDDDMWPGIRMALLMGIPIVHLQTLPITNRYYSTGSKGAQYTEMSL